MKIVFYTFIIFASLNLSGCVGSATSKPTQEQQLTSNQIINIMMAVDKMEIDLPKIATKKEPAPLVKHFAEYLIRQHQNNLDELTLLTNEWKMEPQKSSISDSLNANSKQMAEKLEGLQGTEFDTAYIDAMVKSHQAGLNLIHTKLMPQAKTPQMEEIVEQFRKMVARHLEKALKVQKRLSSH